MCGIVAYKGRQRCLPFLLNGLAKLEYRGYDSAGLTILENNQLATYKSVGPVSELAKLVSPDLAGLSGIAHTRWATHGYEQNNDLMQSIRAVCEKVDGAFAVVLLGENGQMIIARKGSPMVVAYSSSGSGIFVASDSLAVSEYCDKIIYVPDCSVCDLTNGLDKFVNFHDWSPVAYRIEDVSLEDSGADKGGFDHFMLKEIYDQPSCVDMCLRGRICDDQIKLGGFLGYENIFATANHITIVACGSSYHAGILAKYFIEELCGIKTSVEHASEFKYRINNSIKPKDIVIGISQSGETADTISALEEAKSMGALIVGITNVVNSSIARLTDCGIHIRASREISSIIAVVKFMDRTKLVY